MNASQLFTGRAYAFDMREDVDETDVSHEIIEDILSKSKVNIEIDSISKLEGTENFDNYRIVSGDRLYSVKISLDEDCEVLKNEINFLKNNKSALIPFYLDSGLIKIGTNILFLISSHDEGYDIRGEGVMSVIDNSESFFYTLYHFSNLKSKTSCRDYLKSILNEKDIEKYSKVLASNISSNHELKKINKIFSFFHDEVFLDYKEDILEGARACHGSLTCDNIITKNGLYKYKNFGYSFSGNPIFDVCFFAVNSGLLKRDSLLFFKKYCDYNELDLSNYKKEYDYCMKVCSAIYFSKLFFDYLIEEAVFETRRPHKLLSLSVDYSKSYHNLSRLSSCEDIKNTLSTIITRPITDKI